jgi:putative ABC transport system permease protein
MELRLLGAALLRRPGTIALATIAVAIGASVASALLHVSGDLSRRIQHELRALGPNVIITPSGGGEPAPSEPGEATPADASPGASEFLDEAVARERLAGAGVTGAPVLYAIARSGANVVPVAGTDLAAARALHPQWTLEPAAAPNAMGTRLMKRLGVRRGERVTLAFAHGRTETIVVGAALEAGGSDDETWWLPLADVQRLAGVEGKVSLFQARVEGDRAAAERVTAALERGGGVRAEPIGSLSATEASLLERMQRLMTLVTLAALLAAGLCAFGTLADRVLEIRRDFALMMALGAGRRRIIRQFTAEAVAIGLAGGIGGWLFGLGMAEVIGREVFHAAIRMRWDVPLIVLALSLGVALASSVVPVRMALRVEPAVALKGE